MYNICLNVSAVKELELNYLIDSANLFKLMNYVTPSLLSSLPVN